MARFLYHQDAFTFRKLPAWFLAISWLLGLGVGGLVFRNSGETMVTLMPLAAAGQLSIVSLFLSTSLPFLFSAFAVYISKPILLPLIGFGKAVLYGCILCAVFAAFGGSGWLIRFLLLFTDTLSCVLLYGYLGRYVSGARKLSMGDLAFCEICLALLIFLDFCYISPFLRILLS